MVFFYLCVIFQIWATLFREAVGLLAKSGTAVSKTRGSGIFVIVTSHCHPPRTLGSQGGTRIFKLSKSVKLQQNSVKQRKHD